MIVVSTAAITVHFTFTSGGIEIAINFFVIQKAISIFFSFYAER